MTAVTDIISAIGDMRRLMIVSGGMLAADIAGAAVAVPALFRHGDGAGLICSGLLAPVMLSWLIAVLFTILAERPFAVALGDLRCVAGAPVDPSAPWRPLGMRPVADWHIVSEHVVPLIGAATVQHSRARLALAWAAITTVGFMLWVVLSFGVAAAS